MFSSNNNVPQLIYVSLLHIPQTLNWEDKAETGRRKGNSRPPDALPPLSWQVQVLQLLLERTVIQVVGVGVRRHNTSSFDSVSSSSVDLEASVCTHNGMLCGQI